MDKLQILRYLKSIALFKGIEENQLVNIFADSRPVSFQTDEILFYQEDPADVFYILVEGRIKLSQLTPEGDQITLHYLSPGEAFGIIAVLREIRFPVTAQAIEASQCIVWSEEMIKKWIINYPQIAINSIRILSSFILNFQDRIRELSTEKVERRIARSLLRLAMQSGKQTDAGISLGFKLTREDIANMAGTTLYTVSRTLSKWESEGLVDCQHSAITLKAPQAITEIAEDTYGLIKDDLEEPDSKRKE
jgi:CRP-like cAMP-binding protein